MGDTDSSGIDFAAAFTLGVLFGAGVALLLAPQKGDELRKGFAKKGRRLQKDAGQQLGKAGERIRETGGEWLEDAEGRLHDLTDEIGQAVEEGIRTIREAAADEIKELEKKLGRKKGLFR
ncbi:MAG TPA: YtxH domain-containing protein [Gemmatimonadota bacterium]|nr:YtxH domain-containing protein [Gemmatimonadota bacterium]